MIRTNKKQVSFTDDELRLLIKKSKTKTSKELSNWIRLFLLDKEIRPVPEINTNTARQIQGIATNVNQIAKSMNSDKNRVIDTDKFNAELLHFTKKLKGIK